MIPNEWLTLIVGNVLGTISGGLMAWWFERRSSARERENSARIEENNRTLRADNEALRAMLAQMNVNLTTHTGSLPDSAGTIKPAGHTSRELDSQILHFVRGRLDENGSVRQSQVEHHFGKATQMLEIEAAISRLEANGSVAREGRLIRFLQ